MSADNSWGEPQWCSRQVCDNGPYEKAGVGHEESEIVRLRRELMKMQAYLQDQKLDELNEKHFRELHPAVQDAWDKYQTVLQLTKK